MGLSRLKSKCQKGWISSGGFRVESISLPFLSFEGHLHPWPVTPFSCHSSFCFHQYISFSDPDSSSSSFHLWGPLWLRWVFQDNPEWSSYLKTLNLITTENSLLPCKVTHPQVSGNKTWAFLGCIVLSTAFGESEMRQELTTRFLYAD